MLISWGDTNSNVYNGSVTANHSYSSAGTYYVTLSGTATRITCSSSTYLKEITEPFDTNLGNSLTSCDSMFHSCSNLSAIPVGLFDKCPNVTTFRQVLSGTAITSIPAGLFDNCPNVVSFQGAFLSSPITTVPAGLFDNCPLVDTFYNLFANCTTLTSIPYGLFDNCPIVTDFASVFSQSGLASIPSGLFDNCPNVFSFGNVFQLTPITSIPAGLFDNNLSVYYFSGAFRSCTSLTGNAPDLWTTRTYSSSLQVKYCFLGCTGLSNYSIIPCSTTYPCGPYFNFKT